MGFINIFRDDAALRGVKRSEDAYVSDYADRLLHENRTLGRALWWDVRVGLTTDGWRALGRLMATLLVFGAIVWRVVVMTFLP